MRERGTSIVNIAIVLLLLNDACSPAGADSGRPSAEAGDETGGAPASGGNGGGVSAGGSGSSGVSGSSGAGAVNSAGGTIGTGGSVGSGGAIATGGSSGSAGMGAMLPAGVLWFDDFEDGDTAGWIADMNSGDHVGDWAVVNDGATNVYQEQTQYSDPSWAVGGDLAWTAQILEAKVKFVSSSGDAVAYLAVRFQNREAYYFLEFHENETNGSLKIRKRVNGSTTDLISSYSTEMPVVSGTWYTIGLSAVDSTITAYFNGTMIGTATDAELSNGGIALGIVDAVAAFDDVTVSAP